MNSMNVNYLNMTLLGGQAFNWDYVDGSYYGFFKDGVVKIVPSSKGFKVNTFPSSFEFNVQDYLDLSRDYDAVKQRISKDQHMLKAIEHVEDVRILNQDFEQTLLSFILSSNNTINAVRRLARKLSIKYGKKIVVDGKDFFTFPKAEDIASSDEKEIRSLGIGFRSPYLLKAAQKLSEDKLNNLMHKDENEIRDYLTSFMGVGDKIADCVMVFSLKQTAVTPLDVWGKRILVDLYGVDSKLNYQKMREWYKSYFGMDTAFAGQYLFEYYRKVYKKS